MTTISHELKAPLAIILALCDRLERRVRTDPHAARDIGRVRANAETLVDRIDELLLVARLEGGRRKSDATDVDVAAIVRDSAEGFRSVTEQRSQRLIVDASPQQVHAVIDGNHVESIVCNLLANAIRHAPDHGVVRCTLRAGAQAVRIEIADSGAGIAPEQRADIFTRYRHEPGAGGTGIGLAVVSDLVARYGGTVAVGDAPEGGARFVVELPLHAHVVDAPHTPWV